MTCDGISNSYPFNVVDGIVELGDPTEVVQVWIPKTRPAQIAQPSYSRKGALNMPGSGDVKIFTGEQVEAIIARAVSAATESLRTELRERAANEQLAKWSAEGKLTDETKEFARGVLLAGGEEAKNFIAFMEKQPAESEGEKEIEFSDEVKALHAALGISSEKVAQYKGGKVKVA